VKLPHVLSYVKWYTKSGCNQHSRIMYDLNDLKYPQTTNYIYFCIKSGIYTWLDHTLSTSYDIKNAQSCIIQPFDDGNIVGSLVSTIYRP